MNYPNRSPLRSMKPASRSASAALLVLCLSAAAAMFVGCAGDAEPQEASQGNGAVPSDPIDIGSRLELFVDDLLIHSTDGVELTLHRPVLRETVLHYDNPWEGPFSGYPTVLQDNGLFRLYYRGYPSVETKVQMTCYAESTDGIHFEKPNLGMYEVNGTTDNNVILSPDLFPVTHNFAPFIDTNPDPVVPERYKALGGNKDSGLIAYVSEDGIHWNRLQDRPVFTAGAFDSQNVAFYSSVEGRYVCYFRDWTSVAGTRYRSIYRTTSADFLSWSTPVEMDYGDTPREHLYTNQTQAYPRAPHIYIAHAMRFLPGKRVLGTEEARQQQVNEKYRNDCADVVFMSSRAGTEAYNRRFLEAFIRPGLDPGNWASRAALTALNVVRTGPAELSIYRQSHYAQPSARLDRYTIRLDGFVSAHAGYDGGQLVTEPIVFEGRELYLNLSTSAAGSVFVEIQNPEGKSIDGYGLSDAMMLTGDSVEQVVAWTNGTSTAALAGEPIRLRFVMRDADLYAFQFK